MQGEPYSTVFLPVWGGLSSPGSASSSSGKVSVPFLLKADDVALRVRPYFAPINAPAGAGQHPPLGQCE